MWAILEKRRRDDEVELGGYLERPVISGDDAHLPTGPFHQPGVIGRRGPVRVGVRVGVGVGMLKHLAQEPLRGLDGAEPLAIRGRQDMSPQVDRLDGVGHRQPGHDRRSTGANGTDDPVEQVGRRQASGDVMNQDDLVVGLQRGQPRLHRRRTVHPAWHDIDRAVVILCPAVVGGGQALVDMGAGRNDDHVLHLRATKSAPQCVSQ
jgi:hypothetical protein